jgi:plasmid stabilization system protein ParE
LKFEISRRARREIERIGRWWVDNRPDARELFVHELAEAERSLRAAPETEAWRTRSDKVIRRWLLPKTQYHLYYWYEPKTDRLLVVAVWGAARGSNPKL